MYHIKNGFIEKFWDKVDRSGGANSCWEWQGTRLPSQGADWAYGHYGSFFTGYVTTVSHRIAYQLAYGPIPKGMLVLHICDNPPCCNPSHLRAGTHKDNSLDRSAKGRCNASAQFARPDYSLEWCIRYLADESQYTPSDAQNLLLALAESGLAGQMIRGQWHYSHNELKAIGKGLGVDLITTGGY